MTRKTLIALAVAACAMFGRADLKDAKIEALTRENIELKEKIVKLQALSELAIVEDEASRQSNVVRRARQRIRDRRRAKQEAARKGEVSLFWENGNPNYQNMKNALGRITKAGKQAEAEAKKRDEYKNTKRNGSGKRSVSTEQKPAEPKQSETK